MAEPQYNTDISPDNKSVQIVIDCDIPKSVPDADIVAWVKYHLGLRGDINQGNKLYGTEFNELDGMEAVVVVKIDGKKFK